MWKLKQRRILIEVLGFIEKNVVFVLATLFSRSLHFCVFCILYICGLLQPKISPIAKSVFLQNMTHVNDDFATLARTWVNFWIRKSISQLLVR